MSLYHLYSSPGFMRLFIFFCTGFLSLLTVNNLYSQAFRIRDSLKAKVIRVIDGDTYLVKYRSNVFKVRLRMPDPKDTIDTFDRNRQRAQKQARSRNISLDSVLVLAEQAKRFADSLLVGKRVLLRLYADQTDFMKLSSFDRLLRGVELIADSTGTNIGYYLRSRGLTVK